MQRYEEGEAEFKKAIESDPKFVPARLHLGDYYGSKQQFAEAMVQYKAVLELDPKHIDAHWKMARVYGSQR